MSALAQLSSWDVFDPTTTPASSSSGDLGQTSPVASSSSAAFYDPNHELFVFGVVVALTALGMYVATEHSSGARESARANLGPVHAEGDLGVGIGGEK